LKLAPLLAQYLYANKRLDLPGIGSFSLDTSIPLEPEPGKQPGESIHFQSNPSAKESPDLIAFISAQTGKMRALAAADFNSHLELVQEFLNIGKPFLLEGIGSLAKGRAGVYSFSSTTIPVDKIKDHTTKETVMTSATEESFSSYETSNKSLFKLDWRKPALIGLVFIGTGLAIWGGYTVYKRSNPGTETASINNTIPITTSLIADVDTSITNVPVVQTSAKNDGYKFVLETANKTRAYARYATLKKYEWNVQMETQDSVKYKLFLSFPTRDTNWVLDSLTALNGRRVYIERL
jgi:hypothetical protein